MPLPLETERLLIRKFCDADLDEFLAYRSDPIVARYQGWDLPYGRDQGLAFISEMRDASPGTPGKWFQAAIQSRKTQTLIGDCAFHIMSNSPQQAYIGITIARSFWGKGYGEEASRRLLDFLFFELNLHRIVAETDEKNHASMALLKKLGFRCEAHLIENIWFKGAWGSEFHYAILEREWKGR